METWNFIDQFGFFTGYEPYPWQRRLYERFLVGDVPRQLALPTGLGKTSVMVVWLLALAAQAQKGRVALPRRLVYVVNRRTVVDQATQIAEDIRTKLLAPHPVPKAVREQLQKLTVHQEMPLAIATLRGQFADSGEWKEDPTRPAIICGTVDMIGSKLLFSGYGDSFKRRPVHAGLLGQDSLLVHDEAHLEPAFEALLQRVFELQRGGGTWHRRMRLMALSATLRQASESAFTLDAEDRKHPEALQRLSARKILTLHEAKSQEVARRVAELAARFEGQPVRVLVFVRSPVTAQEEVVPLLRKATGASLSDRLVLLTGTMRGAERDSLLLERESFRVFLTGKPPAKTHYLVATSAGEVGVDLDADHLITELAPLDSLLQRLGRVNRRGGVNRAAEVHVVVPKDLRDGDPLAQSLRATSEVLHRWVEQEARPDLSPQNLDRLLNALTEDERQQAFSPVPPLATLTDIHLDCLAATSAGELPPGGPHVPQLLHGEEPVEPEVYVLWRRELPLFAAFSFERRPQALREWLHLCPPVQRELVRLPLPLFSKLCSTLAKNAEASDTLAVVLGPRSEAVTTLGELAQGLANDLAFTTVVLDAVVGGLDKDTGAVDPKAPGPVLDVAEGNAQGEPLRRRLVRLETNEGTPRFVDLDGREADVAPGWEVVGSVVLEEDDEGTATRSLCLLLPVPEVSQEEAEQARGELTLATHTEHVVAWVREIASRLNVPEEIQAACETAAHWHDWGKSDPLWQHFAYAEGRGEPLAKARRYRDPRVLAGFRHELASWRAMRPGQEPELVAALAKHLVVSHHGWARPFFPLASWDGRTPAGEQEQALADIANNFALLQREYGWWTLAWLEAVFRAADALASRYQAPPPSVQPGGVAS